MHLVPPVSAKDHVNGGTWDKFEHTKHMLRSKNLVDVTEHVPAPRAEVGRLRVQQ